MKKVLVMMIGGVIFTLLTLGLSYAQDIEEVGRLEGEFERAWGLAFSPDGGLAYVPGKGESNPTVWIINITSPSSPTLLGTIEIPNPNSLPPEAWGVKVVGDYLYVAAFKCGLWIYDITNTISPVEKGSYTDGMESREVFVEGNYAYVADAWNGLRILNIENPENPTEVSLYNTAGDLAEENAEFHDVKVIGPFAYCAGGNFGLVIINVSNPAAPQGVSYCCDAATIGEGSWGRGIDVSGNYAYLGDNNTGLRIAEISNPAAPYEVGSYVGGDELWKMQVIGDIAFVPFRDGRFIILNISNPTAPTEVTSASLVGKGQAVLIKEDYAYVVTTSSLIIFDVSPFLTGVEDKENSVLPSSYVLHQNYPNPFNPATTIEYELEKPGWVSLKIYDVNGQEVANLVDGDIGVGVHRVNWTPTGLASGVYYYTISVNEFRHTRKLLFMK